MELQPESVPRGNERILLLDDDELGLTSVRNMLERLGYKITGFTDGEEGLKVFLEKPYEFDLVITDHLMPDSTGEEIAQKMLRIRSDIPIMLCTGKVDPPWAKTAMATGVRGVIEKPFTVRECAQIVRSVLNEDRSK